MLAPLTLRSPATITAGKLATLKQYRGFLLTHHKLLLFSIYFDAFPLTLLKTQAPYSSKSYL